MVYSLQMAIYELTCVFAPQSDSKKLMDKVEGWLKEIGAKIKKKDEWGKKKLAYQIGNHSEGWYVLWRLEAKPDRIGNLAPEIKLEEKIIRNLLVRINGRKEVG